jgi:uncharacterized protein (TIGR00251 family)
VIPLGSAGAAVTFAVRVVPRAGRTGAAGHRGDALIVRLAAAPVDDAANDELIGYLASVLRHPRRDLAIVSGHRSRNKRIAVSNASPEAVASALSAILAT